MQKWTTILNRLLTPEGGASMIEYGLMLALIALAAVAAVAALGLALPGIFEAAADGFP